MVCMALVLAWAPVPAQQSETQRRTEPAQGSAPEAQRKKLTLQGALELAARENLDLRTARLRRAVAQAGIRIARQIPNPSVSFSSSRDSPHQSLLFEQPLEIGGKRGRRIELARQQAELTGVEISTVERQVRRKVRQAFYGAALARGISQQRGEALQLAKRLRDIAQARFDAGDVAQLEVYQAELEVARADAELGVALQREKIAFSQLNVLLNAPADALWDTGIPLTDLPPQMPLSELVQRATQANPDYQHVLQEQKVEQSHSALLRAERIPDLHVQFGSDFNAPNDFRVGPRGQLLAVLPVFARNQGEIAQSSANLRLLESEAEAVRRSVAGRIEAAYFELTARRTQVELYRRSLLPAGQRLQSLAEDSYRAGKANILTVLDAQRNAQQITRDYLDSLFALHSAFAELEETTGAALD